VGRIACNFGDERLPQRFWDKVQPCPMSGCWLWVGSLGGDGYGIAVHEGRLVSAHRRSFAVLSGKIPKGLQLDHLCRVRCCVNPAHLEPVTQRTNSLRGVGFTAVNAKKTHCPKGHAYDEANTYKYPKSGARYCRACKRAQWTKKGSDDGTNV